MYRDREIVQVLVRHSPTIVAIDAPLRFPSSGWYRRVDLALKRLGYKVLPPMWRGMKLLVERAIKLSNFLDEAGVRVVETHPHSAWISSGCNAPLQAPCSILDCTLLEGKSLSKDVVDAIIALAVAVLCLEDKCYCVRESDGSICLLPKLC